MRWHVGALAAVWLIVGWCGSAVMGQPIAGMLEGQLQPQGGQLISETWGLMESVDENVDNAQNDYSRGDKLYYLPSVPIKRQPADDDSGWLLQSQDRSKRQSNSNSGSPSNHHSQLSIISPIEALRSRLRLEMLRRQWGNQIKQNQDKLERVGKRRKRSDLASVSTHVGISDEKRMSQLAAASAVIKAP